MSEKLISGAEYMIDIRNIKKIYKMGDKVKIKVISTDRVLKRIDFEFVNE